MLMRHVGVGSTNLPEQKGDRPRSQSVKAEEPRLGATPDPAAPLNDRAATATAASRESPPVQEEAAQAMEALYSWIDLDDSVLAGGQFVCPDRSWSPIDRIPFRPVTAFTARGQGNEVTPQLESLSRACHQLDQELLPLARQGGLPPQAAAQRVCERAEAVDVATAACMRDTSLTGELPRPVLNPLIEGQRHYWFIHAHLA
jgi:hypothetical protein